MVETETAGLRACGWEHRCAFSQDKRDWYWRARPRQQMLGATLEYAFGGGRWCWECPECGTEWESMADRTEEQATQ